MKKIGVLVLSLLFLLSATVVFGSTRTYQVTGPVLEVTSTVIVVQKGTDRWEIARDAATKVTGDLKVGSKVTIEYRMTATSITSKDEKASTKAAKPAKKH